MDLVFRIVVVMILFSIFAIFSYSSKKKAEKTKHVRRVKLEADAQRYFTTICHKLLTPIGDKDNCESYLTFQITGDHLFVLKVYNKKKIKSRIVITAKFEGQKIVDQTTNLACSYSGFERNLAKVVRGSPVYGPHIEHLWERLNEPIVQ